MTLRLGSASGPAATVQCLEHPGVAEPDPDPRHPGREDPEGEYAKDVWNLVAFGHRGSLVFTVIGQP